MTIPIPQTSLDTRQVVKGVDSEGNLIFEQVAYTDLDFSSLTGFKTTSTSEATIQFGKQYFALDTDDERMKAGVVVQCTASDPDCWIWGVVLSKDYVAEPARIQVATLRPSPLTGTFGGTYGGSWEIQIVSGPMLGFSPDATIGISSDSLTVPAVGQVITANIGGGLYVSRNMTLLFSDAVDFDNNFRVRVLDYDESTGDGEFICTGRNANSGDAIEAWIVSLIPGPVSGSGELPTEVTKVAEATSNDSATITVPSGIEAGDLLVLVERGFDNAGTSDSFSPVIDGFSVVGGFGTGNVIVEVNSTTQLIGRVSFKIADGSESSAVLSGMTGFDEMSKVLVVFRPNASISGAQVSGVVSNSGTGNPTQQVIDSSEAVGPAVVIGAYMSNSAVDPRTMSPAKDGEATATGNEAYLAWKIYNSSPADVTIDMDDEGQANIIIGCYFTFVAAENLPGDVVVFEDDGVGGPLYPAGDGSQIDLSGNTTLGPKVVALYSARIQTTAAHSGDLSFSGSTVTSTGTVVAPTGSSVRPVGTWPASITVGQMYYLRKLTSLTFSLHTSFDDANTGTDAISYASSPVGATLLQFFTDGPSVSYGMADLGFVNYPPVGGVPGTTTMQLEFNLAADLPNDTDVTTGEIIITPTGSYIGDATINGGLAAAFDGVTSQASASCAAKLTATTIYCGMDISASPKAITKAICYGSNNNGYVPAANPSITITLYGKQGGAPANRTDGTSLGTVTFTDTANESGNPRTITSSDTTTLWDYVWCTYTVGSAATINFAEIEFYTDTPITTVTLLAAAELDVANMYTTAPASHPVWRQGIASETDDPAVVKFTTIRPVGSTATPGTWAQQDTNAFDVFFRVTTVP